MNRKLLLLPLVLTLVGCSDSATSLSRDYRNLNNEVLDALMMVTNETSAKWATDKIVKPYADRKGNIDKREQTWELNTDDREVCKDVMSSESVAMLFAEHLTNKKRLQLETARLKKLLEANVSRETERLRQGGDPNPVVDPRKHWPTLNDLAMGTSTLPLKNNLESIGGCNLTRLHSKFPTKEWEKHRPANFAELQEAMKKKVDRFVEMDIR